MAGKIILPHESLVAKWKEEKVIKWIKRVHLDDCIPAFEARHIDGQSLLELTEQKLFTFQDLKIKRRKQIAKCVQECKSQASNAKKLIGTIKHSHGPHSKDVITNGAYESDESGDWGTDFDTTDEEDDEVNGENTIELNNNTVIKPPSESPQKVSNGNQPVDYNSNSAKSIPKPPDLPVITKAIANPGVRNSQHTNGIPRPPLKRPPSQPPPPPVAQAPSQVENQQDYEIPINPQSASAPLAAAKESGISRFISSCENSAAKDNGISRFISSCENSAAKDSGISRFISSCENSAIETYEIIEPPEENYEVVDVHSPIKPPQDKPILPPRLPLSTNPIAAPPPLPQKPRKIHETLTGQESPQGIRTFVRPKPLKTDDSVHSEASASSSTSISASFFSTLLGRKSSVTPSSSPKILHRSRDGDAGASSSVSTVSSNDGHSSRSSSPDRDVGSSFTNLASLSSENRKTVPAPPLPPRGAALTHDETVQNMATRPLPPVPTAKVDTITKNEKQDDVQQYPWFHEMERQDAEDVVRRLNESGSFVVRPSKRAGIENPYSLTILHDGKIFHLNIRQRSDNRFALGKEKKKEKTFPTVADLIAYHQCENILLTSRGEPAGQTILDKYPEKT